MLNLDNRIPVRFLRIFNILYNRLSLNCFAVLCFYFAFFNTSNSFRKNFKKKRPTFGLDALDSNMSMFKSQFTL